MLNEDKIKEMIALSCMEKKNHRDLTALGKYFRSDYISKNMLRAFFVYTLIYLFLMLIAILYNMQILLDIINVFEVVKIFRNYIIFYCIGLVVFEILTFWLSHQKYGNMSRIREEYFKKLKKLEKRYEFESRSKELSKESKEHE